MSGRTSARGAVHPAGCFRRRYHPVALTSVHVPRFEIGANAAQLVLQLIRSGDLLHPQPVEFEATLVVRGSTRALGESEVSGR